MNSDIWPIWKRISLRVPILTIGKKGWTGISNFDYENCRQKNKTKAHYSACLNNLEDGLNSEEDWEQTDWMGMGIQRLLTR